MLDRISANLHKSNNITRGCYVWNAVSAIILAMQSPLILMVLTRTNGVEDAGVFSIGIAVANMMMYVGQYGMRRFQSSDIHEEFVFEEYHAMRIVTCIAMIFACFGYCLLGTVNRGYSFEKAFVIFMICMVKLVQAYSDVYHGNMQQKGRLDVASKAATLRYSMEIVVFCVVIMIKPDLVLASIINLSVSVIIMLLTSVNTGRAHCRTLKPSIKWDRLKNILMQGFPLFVSMFLNIYVGNVPKYAIDACMDDTAQAIFNLIVMPAFVVQIATQFLFNPIVTEYADLWLAHSREKYDKLLRIMRKMMLIVLALSILGLAVAATIGIPILSWIFGVELGAYKRELCIIMIGGGMLAYATYFATIIAIIRAQRTLIYAYGVVALVGLVAANPLVRSMGITGASIIYSALMCILAILLGIVVKNRFRKEKFTLAAATMENAQ